MLTPFSDILMWEMLFFKKRNDQEGKLDVFLLLLHNTVYFARSIMTRVNTKRNVDYFKIIYIRKV